MQAQLTTLHSLHNADEQTAAIESVKDIPVKRKKTALSITIIKLNLFFGKLSPLHWYDDFKVMKINLDEFMCKKNSQAPKDVSEESGKV
jgi:hypothetical protein